MYQSDSLNESPSISTKVEIFYMYQRVLEVETSLGSTKVEIFYMYQRPETLQELAKSTKVEIFYMYQRKKIKLLSVQSTKVEIFYMYQRMLNKIICRFIYKSRNLLYVLESQIYLCLRPYLQKQKSSICIRVTYLQARSLKSTKVEIFYMYQRIAIITQLLASTKVEIFYMYQSSLSSSVFIDLQKQKSSICIRVFGIKNPTLESTKVEIFYMYQSIYVRG